MILLVGLGNPGKKYEKHRHNIGFMAVDSIADAFNFDAERLRFQSVSREGFIETPAGRKKALILKPTTYMNESGRAVGEAFRFYKTEPENVFVFHDELDLAPAKIRVKKGGGVAGHNGLRSITSHITNDYWRIRLGIGHPGNKARVSGHVLGDFSKQDKVWLEPLLDEIGRAAPLLVSGDDAGFMNKVSLAVQPEKPKKQSAKNSNKSSEQE